MANHKSAIKRIKVNQKKKLINRYFHKTTRTAIKKIRNMQSKDEVLSFMPKVVSLVDRMVAKNIFHKNKAANIKSKLMKKLNAM